MKKIMFNDKYGLTRAVLEGHKTMTRRIAYDKPMQYEHHVGHKDGYLILLDGWCRVAKSAYRVGEVVAVAQDYNHVLTEYLSPDNINNEAFDDFHEWSHKQPYGIWDKAGLSNKMFVRADLMPHLIRINGIKVEQLQDITNNDAMREGVFRYDKPPLNHECDIYAPWPPYIKPYVYDADNLKYFCEARYAFKYLINKVCGWETWIKNPFVFAYEFELIR